MLALKIDVDTQRGTRDGVLPLAELCRRESIPGLFLFSLGPDRMGRSIFRLFKPGFLRKVLRTRVASHYGLSTLLNGTLKPAPHLGRRYGHLMRQVRDWGFDVGIHCYDHYRWQNHVHSLSLAATRAEFAAAMAEFQRVFGEPARVAGAPGWQCTAHSLAVYDEFALHYASDTRGDGPFRPSLAGRVFRTPQLPTTLPTLDELVGRPGFGPKECLAHYLNLIETGAHHVLTIHAELEGLNYLDWFHEFIRQARQRGVEFRPLRDLLPAAPGPASLPVCEVIHGEIEGRSGRLAVQAATRR